MKVVEEKLFLILRECIVCYFYFLEVEGGIDFNIVILKFVYRVFDMRVLEFYVLLDGRFWN